MPGPGEDRRTVVPSPSTPEVAAAQETPMVVSLDYRAALGIVAGILAVFLLVSLVSASARAITQIGVGMLLAFALEPLVKRVQRRLRCPRAVGVAVVAALVMIGFGTLVFVMGPPAAKQAQEFGQELPQAVRDLYRLPLIGDRLREADAAGEVQQWAEDLPGRLDAERVSRAAETLVNGVLTGFTVLLVALVVLLDGEVLVRRAREAVPEKFRSRADDVGRVFYRVVGTYFAGSLLVAVMGGTFVLAVGLILGVPLAPVAAVWYAMVSLIPQVGGFLGISFFTILALSQGVFVGLIGLVLLLLYMNLENYVISPAVVGQSVNLSPPTTMLAALVGAATMGVPGALAATPLCGTVKALWLEYRFGEEVEASRKPGFLRHLKPPAFLRKLFGRA